MNSKRIFLQHRYRTHWFPDQKWRNL